MDKEVLKIVILCFLCAIGISGFDNPLFFFLAFWPLLVLPFVINYKDDGRKKK